MILCIYTFKYNNKTILVNGDNDYSINTNALTMMYETASGSGEYQVSSSSAWPQDGYIFNETLSSCENGSTLTWDEENKRVLMQANVSDKCYVYFDKEPNIIIINTTGSRVPNVRFNNNIINDIGQAEYNVGDIIYFVPYVNSMNVKIYDKNNNLVTDITNYSCETVSYELTGIEYRIELLGYTVGAHPEICTVVVLP